MLFVLFYGIHTQAQTVDAEPEKKSSKKSKEPEILKGANVINVKLPYPADSLFLITGRAFLDAGYIVISKDEQFKTISATLNEAGGHTYTIEVNARVEDSVVSLTGTVDPKTDVTIWGVTSKSSKFNLENKGAGTIIKQAFGIMNKFAKSLNGHVTYEKR